MTCVRGYFYQYVQHYIRGRVVCIKIRVNVSYKYGVIYTVISTDLFREGGLVEVWLCEELLFVVPSITLAYQVVMFVHHRGIYFTSVCRCNTTQRVNSSASEEGWRIDKNTHTLARLHSTECINYFEKLQNG